MKNFNSLTTGLICPVCESDSLILRQRTSEIADYGRIIKQSLTCQACYFTQTDFIPLFTQGPSRIEFKIENIQDLDTKILKSRTCKLKIPEVNITLEPDPESASIISDIRNVLEDIHTELDYNNEQSKLNILKNIRDGTETATIILEDPEGISTIISKKIKKQLI